MRAEHQVRKLDNTTLDPIKVFTNAIRKDPPWDSIVDFAVHKSFCGIRLYPKQATLLKLIFLETEHFTQYDWDVLESWMAGFKKRKHPFGVQPDVLDRIEYLKANGYKHFTHIEAVLGRRGSKGLIGGILGARMLAWMVFLDDWQNHYGIIPGKEGYILVTAVNMYQAIRFQFADILNVVTNCRYLQPYISARRAHYLSLQTPADLRRIAEMKVRKIPIEDEIASLRAVAVAAQSASVRGAVSFMNAYDEFAHQLFGTGSVKSGELIYDAAQPSLDQFGQDAITYVPSSPFTRVGRFYQLYQEGSVLMPTYLEREQKVELTKVTEKSLGIDAEEELDNAVADPEMLVVQLPSWALYEDWQRCTSIMGYVKRKPIQWDPDGPGPLSARMKRLEHRNPEAFKVERRAQFADVQDAYLDPDMVDKMFEPVSWRAPSILAPQDFGRVDREYYIHCDPGRTNANFAMAVAHLENSAVDEYGDVWPHVIFDYLRVWKKEDFPKRIISYTQVRRDICQFLTKFPSTKRLTFDQWNSASMIEDIREAFPKLRVVEVTFTEPENLIRAERFKSALNLGWVHSYADNFFGGESLLEAECKYLQEKNGKVIKQEIGPVQTKDLFDCYDSETEVLTEYGWKFFKDVALSERVATVNSQGVMEYQYPTDRVDRYYKGKMIRGLADVHNPSFSFCVTPGHRMLETRSVSYSRAGLGPAERNEAWDYFFTKAEDLTGTTRLPITARGLLDCDPSSTSLAEVHPDALPGVNWTTDQIEYLERNYSTSSMVRLMHVCNKSSRWSIYNKATKLGLRRGQIGDRVKDRPALLPECRTEDFARFVGFWLGDGGKIKFNGHGYGIEISQTKLEGIEYLEKLFANLGWDYRRASYPSSPGEVRFYVYSYELREYLRPLGLQGSFELHLPREAFTVWNRGERLALVEGLLRSDGTGDTLFASSSKTLIDEVQHLLLTCGLASSVKKIELTGTPYKICGATGVSTHDGYELSIYRKRSQVLVHESERVFVDYEGMVHCLTVPNSILVTRRDGNPLVAGNCVAEVTSVLLKDALDRHRTKLLGITAFGSTDVAGLRNGRELDRLGMLTSRGQSRGLSEPMSSRDKLNRLREQTKMRSLSNLQRVSPTRGRR